MRPALRQQTVIFSSAHLCPVFLSFAQFCSGFLSFNSHFNSHFAQFCSVLAHTWTSHFAQASPTQSVISQTPRCGRTVAVRTFQHLIVQIPFDFLRVFDEQMMKIGIEDPVPLRMQLHGAIPRFAGTFRHFLAALS